MEAMENSLWAWAQAQCELVSSYRAHIAVSVQFVSDLLELQILVSAKMVYALYFSTNCVIPVVCRHTYTPLCTLKIYPDTNEWAYCLFAEETLASIVYTWK